MTISVSPSESNAQAALRSFMLGVLPSGVEVIRGQDNQVPPPQGVNYVVMTPTRRARLSTNLDSYIDARFVASMTADVLDVTQATYGAIKVGTRLFGIDVTDGTEVTEFITGSGGVGTYRISPGQNRPPGIFAGGVFNALTQTEICFQLDFHGPQSAEQAQIVSTLFRDIYGVQKLADSGYDVSPLYADDPKQVPFINAQNQWEDRWVLEAHVQSAEIVLDVPQQFAEQVVVGLVNVDVKYPA